MKTLLTAILMVMSAYSVEASVICHTPRENKIFKIEHNKVTFFNEFDSAKKRELASVFSRNKSTPEGLTKIVDFENHKHTIFIKDLNNFSDSEDYIVIRAKNGHEVTYPLLCKNQ